MNDFSNFSSTDCFKNIDSEPNKIILDDLNDLLAIENFESVREKWYKYNYNGFNVPRVTSIISETINKEFLNTWAAKLGEDYKRTLDSILDTGTLTHAMIEDYITKGKISSTGYDNVEFADTLKANRAYHNFINFWNDMKKRGFTITPIAVEKEFATPWYGGTIDFVANITDEKGFSKNFILDFKTSVKISYQYILQVAAYLYAYNWLKFEPFIDGIGIIRIDKLENKYEYILADVYNDASFINNAIDNMWSMVNWYYRKYYMEDLFRKYRSKYIEEGGIYGLYG